MVGVLKFVVLRARGCWMNREETGPSAILTGVRCKKCSSRTRRHSTVRVLIAASCPAIAANETDFASQRAHGGCVVIVGDPVVTRLIIVSLFADTCRKRVSVVI